MTVKELYEELGKLVEDYSDNRVIASCSCKIGGEEYTDYYLTEINDIYYQSGDIEIEFSNKRDDD
jgi:hypothetical protein